MIERMSSAPARIFGLPGGALSPGSNADLVIFDPDAKQTFTHFVSRSQNSPFLGWQLFGVVERTLVDGQTVYQRDTAATTATAVKPATDPRSK
jgi:dihydroorotase